MSAAQRSVSARVGGRARWAAMTPQQQGEVQRRTRLASLVTGIIRRVDQLTPDQRARLGAALGYSTPPPEVPFDARPAGT